MDDDIVVDFGLFPDLDGTRYCFLRLRVLKEAIKDPRVLDALVDQLQVPGKRLKTLSPEEKMGAIERQIDHFRGTKTSVWYGIPAAEVLAASIYRADKLSNRMVGALFSDVRREEELAAPVIAWLHNKDLLPYKEVPLGTKRVDVVGYQKGGFLTSTRIVGVELKNELSQLKRALDQMTTFAEYAHLTYLACTPALAAAFLDQHAEAPNVRHWDAEVFRRKLQAFGFGLLLVEGVDVYEVLEPKEKVPDARKLKEFTATIQATAGARG